MWKNLDINNIFLLINWFKGLCWRIARLKPGSNFLIFCSFPLLSGGSDFQFGLGSFSLLEEITSGQEWAKFLTPNSASASADQRTLQEVKAPTFSTQSLIPNHSSNNWRGFRDRVASPFSDASVTEAGPGDFQHVSMDVSEEEQCGHRATEQMESMERGHAPSDMRTGRQRRPLSQVAH